MESWEWKYNVFGFIESADERLLNLMKALSEKTEVRTNRKSLFIKENNQNADKNHSCDYKEENKPSS